MTSFFKSSFTFSLFGTSSDYSSIDIKKQKFVLNKLYYFEIFIRSFHCNHLKFKKKTSIGMKKRIWSLFTFFLVLE